MQKRTSFSLSKTTRKYHKWLMAFLGIQFMIWSITGAYMVFFNLDYIHGNTLVHNHQTKLLPSQVKVPIGDLVKRFGEINSVSLSVIVDEPVYQFRVAEANDETQYLVSAKTGNVLSPIGKTLAVAIAEHEYTGSGSVISATLIEKNPPYELSSRRLPAWRVDFDDFGSPALYISSETGAVVTKRHQWWRLFDWMFRFHIMDYQDSETDNWLLFWFSLFGLLASISGLFLVYFRVIKAKSKSHKTQAVEVLA